MSDISAKPFLSWPGGKKQLLKHILPLIPNDINTYHEPFVGGGAVFFSLPQRPKWANLGDVNWRLICTYEAIHEELDFVIDLLKGFQDTQEFYYDARKRFNEYGPRDFYQGYGAALFIYLNKTCFNGLYRENSKGQMNSPYGHHPKTGKISNICDEVTLREAQAALQNSDGLVGDFEWVLDQAAYGDFVYFDPPYIPLNANSFTKYHGSDFGISDHKRLKGVCDELNFRGVRWLLSNSDCATTREIWAGSNFREVKANRVINSKSSGRGKVGELLISNY